MVFTPCSGQESGQARAVASRIRHQQFHINFAIDPQGRLFVRLLAGQQRTRIQKNIRDGRSGSKGHSSFANELSIAPARRLRQAIQRATFKLRTIQKPVSSEMTNVNRGVSLAIICDIR